MSSSSSLATACSQQKSDDQENSSALKALHEKGNSCFREKFYSKAIYYYAQGIELAPNSSVLLANRAQCHLKLKRWENAYADAHSAIERDPGNVKAYFRRAQAEAKLGLRARACADIGHVLAVEPVNPEARAVLAELLATAAGDGNKPVDTGVVPVTLFSKDEPLQSTMALHTVSIHLK